MRERGEEKIGLVESMSSSSCCYCWWWCWWCLPTTTTTTTRPRLVRVHACVRATSTSSWKKERKKASSFFSSFSVTWILSRWLGAMISSLAWRRRRRRRHSCSSSSLFLLMTRRRRSESSCWLSLLHQTQPDQARLHTTPHHNYTFYQAMPGKARRIREAILVHFLLPRRKELYLFERIWMEKEREREKKANQKKKKTTGWMHLSAHIMDAIQSASQATGSEKQHFACNKLRLARPN